MQTDSDTIPPAVLDAYGLASSSRLHRIATGLINASWMVEDSAVRLIVQRLNKIFSPSVNETIDKATHFLASRGMNTFRIQRTIDQQLQYLHDAYCWRALSVVEGDTYQVVENKTQAHSAARLLANFHQIMHDYPQVARLPIATVHNISKHLGALQEALRVHQGHRFYRSIQEVAGAIFDRAETLPPLPEFPRITIHGDPKISNFLFDDRLEALCLVDLDTLGRGQLLHEIGDALRSWCNPHGEDTADTIFDLDIFATSVNAYASNCSDKFDKSQLRYVGLATQTIYLELAARFCADALKESYFAWDPENFSSASEHQLTRARGQLSAADALNAQSDKINDISHALALG